MEPVSVEDDGALCITINLWRAVPIASASRLSTTVALGREFWPTVSQVDDGELRITAHQECHAYRSHDLLAYGDTNPVVSIPNINRPL